MTGVSLVEPIGYFNGFRFIVIKGEYGLAACHAPCDPLGVFYGNLAPSHVVNYVCDDGIQEGA